MQAQTIWDNKFGVMDKKCGFQMVDGKCGYALPDTIVDCKHTSNPSECAGFTPDIHKIIEGVGRDAEIVVNEKGGKQSKTPMAMHLVDPRYLEIWAINGSDKCTTDEGICCFDAIYWIARFMQSGNKDHLCFAINGIEPDELKATVRIAKVLQIGADRYEPNNWRLIPQESHINHALIHLVAHLSGDTQDEHLDHALCRLMMAHATEKSEGFDYGKYVKRD